MERDDELRRREFGAFLRSRRERLAPREVGLPMAGRRRTPGLRREEVALLAGVGTTWYTWLEQGRSVQPSRKVLAAMAQVLQLSEDERRYLFSLAGHMLPSDEVGERTVPAAIQELINSMPRHPACAIDRCWNVLGWNAAAAATFCDYGALPPDERNVLYLLFASAAKRELIVDWEDTARSCVAIFRRDSRPHAGEPDFERLVSRVQAISPEFRRWWAFHEVARPVTSKHRLMHPRVGLMAFERVCLSVADAPQLQLLVHLPCDCHDTRHKLDQLLVEPRSPGAGAPAAVTP